MRRNPTFNLVHDAVTGQTKHKGSTNKRIARFTGGLLLGALLMGPGLVQAQTAGSLVISTGWLNVSPQVKTGPMNSTISTPAGSRNLPPDGAISSQVRSTNTIGLTATYFVTDNIAAEMVAGIPPTFTITGAGSAEGFGTTGKARMWSPTVLMKYYFGSGTAKLRPFVGLGATYIWFDQARITNRAFEEKLGGHTKVSMSRGFSPVFNAGLSYEFTKNWYAGLSVSYIPVKRTLTLDTPSSKAAGGARVTSTVRSQLNPIVTYVNIGYRF